MTRFRALYTLSIVFILSFHILDAANKYPKEENQLWTSFSLSYQLTNEIDIDLEQELRFDDNRSELNQTLTDIGFSYNIAKGLKTGLYYRLRGYIKDEEIRNELYANLSYKYSISDFDISNRLRLQVKFPYGEETNNILRNKLNLSYKIKDKKVPFLKSISPFLSYEIFYRFLYSDGDRFNQERFSAGLSFDLPKDNEISIYFTREIEFNVKKPLHSSILGVSYSFGIK